MALSTPWLVAGVAIVLGLLQSAGLASWLLIGLAWTAVWSALLVSLVVGGVHLCLRHARARRKEVVRRPLVTLATAPASAAAPAAATARHDRPSSNDSRAGNVRHATTLYPKSQRIDAQIRAAVDLVVSSKVSSWYGAISGQRRFVDGVRGLMLDVVLNVRLRLEAVDPVVLVVGKLLPLVTSHLHELAVVEGMVLRSRPALAASHDAKAEAVAQAFSELHPGAKHGSEANPAGPRRAACRAIVDRILPSLLPHCEWSSKVVTTLLREIVACGVLCPLLETLTDPEVLNELIIQHATNAVRAATQVQEYKTVYREMQTRQERRRIKKAQILLQEGDERAWSKLLKKIDRYDLAKLMRLRDHLGTAWTGTSDVASVVERERRLKKPPQYDQVLAKINSRIQLLSGNRAPTRPLDVGNLTVETALTSLAFHFIDFMESRDRIGLISYWNTVVALKVALAQSEMPEVQATVLDENDVFLAKQHIEKLFGIIAREEHLSVTDDEKQYLSNYVENEPDNYDMEANDIVVAVARRCHQTLVDEDLPAFKAALLRLQADDAGVKRSEPAPNQWDRWRPTDLKALKDCLRFSTYDANSRPLPMTAMSYSGESVNDELASAMATVMSTPSARTSTEFDLELDMLDCEDEVEAEQDGRDSIAVPSVAIAGPGDLVLRESVQNIDRDIETANIELQHVELRRSQASSGTEKADLKTWMRQLQRQLRYLHAQRSQYELQRSEHGLFGTSQVTIDGTTIEHDREGDYVVYIISLIRKNSADDSVNGWFVGRRYSEFAQLYSNLRMQFPHVIGKVEFPKKQFGKKLRNVSQIRRPVLEHFLRTALLDEAICESYELRAFLSQSNEMSRHKSWSLLDGLVSVSNYAGSLVRRISEDALNADSRPTFNRMATGETPSFSVNGNPDTRLVKPEPMPEGHVASGRYAADSLFSSTTHDPSKAGDDDNVSNLARPIVNFVLEAFDLGRPDRAIRKRAIVLVIQQLLGGTIETRVRDAMLAMFDDERIESGLSKIKDMLVPGVSDSTQGSADAASRGSSLETDSTTTRPLNGETRPAPLTSNTAEGSAPQPVPAAAAAATIGPSQPRSALQRDIQRSLALTTLKQYHPSYIPTTAAQRLHAAIQYRDLNLHLALTILDAVTAHVFGAALATNGSASTAGAPNAAHD